MAAPALPLAYVPDSGHSLVVPPHIKVAAKIVLWAVVVSSAMLLAVRAYGFIKDVIEAGGDLPKVLGWRDLITPETLNLAAVGAGAALVATADAWWPPLRKQMGIPDPAPTLQFIWPDDVNQRLIHSRDSWDVVLTVRNPSPTATLTSVRVVLEWWMGADYLRAGASIMPRERLLQLQFAPEFQCTLGPLGRERFRLCRMIGEGDNHSLVIAHRDSGESFDAGAGKFVFNVRASADNAKDEWDFYEIDAAPYGVFGTTRNSEAARRPAQ